MSGLVQCLVGSKHSLAESPVYNKWRHSMIYIDIVDCCVHEFFLEDKRLSTIQFDEMVGAVALIDEKTILVAVKNKLVKVNLDTHNLESLIELDIEADMRVNDGKCDVTGRLWLGTIVIEKDVKKRFERGELYTLETNKGIRKHLEHLTISNGMCWDDSKKLMYFTDSYTNKIKTYEFDEARGLMTFKCCKIDLTNEIGTPDGFTIDIEGMLWVALFGGGSVIRINPENGEILSRIKLPDKLVTCCIFGGTKLDTLYITTAAEDPLKKGGLYAFKTNTSGYETNYYQLINQA